MLCLFPENKYWSIGIKTKLLSFTRCKVTFKPVTVLFGKHDNHGRFYFSHIQQLVSYAGYDVIEAQSRTRVGKTKISKKGNSRIRIAMHMPSLVAIQCEVKPFKDLFDRTYKKHGIKMKSYVAVQKKSLIVIYHI